MLIELVKSTCAVRSAAVSTHPNLAVASRPIPFPFVFACLNIWPRGVSAAGREVMSIVAEQKAKIYPYESI